MTFEEFAAYCLGKQRAYIAEQREKMTALEALRVEHNPQDFPFHLSPLPYKLAAGEIGYHPLTSAEIKARVAQLGETEAAAPVECGNTPGMRAIFEVGLWRGEGLMSQPLCRYCGKPIPKRTTKIQFGAQRERTTAGGFWRERTEKPATREEAQRFVNEALTAVRYGDTPRRVVTAFTWDGESYIDRFFCKNECAMALGHMAAREGKGAPAYLEAVKAERDCN